jgi:sugar lactone lactonase YvrE
MMTNFRSVFMGVAIAPDNRTLYASSGNQGVVFVFDLDRGQTDGDDRAECD